MCRCTLYNLRASCSKAFIIHTATIAQVDCKTGCKVVSGLVKSPSAVVSNQKEGVVLKLPRTQNVKLFYGLCQLWQKNINL